MSRHFHDLLKTYENDFTDPAVQQSRSIMVMRSKLLCELKLLFDRLQYPQSGCTIDNVIANGPEQFRGGKGSKDCKLYIDALFEKITR